MKYALKFEKVLPMVNLTENFIISEEAHSTIAEDWLACIEYTLDKAFDDHDNRFKSIRTAVKTRDSLFVMSDKAKNLLGIGSKFSVVEIGISGNRIHVKPLMGYKELIDMYFSDNNPKVHGLTVRAIIDRFFAYQWSKQKLLYPITKTPPNYQRPEDWQDMIRMVELSTMLDAWFKQKTNVSLSVNYRRSAINSVLTSTRWYTPDQINDTELSLVQEAISAGGVGNSDTKNERKTHDFQILVMNELRYMLIDSGRVDIRSPRDISKEKRGSLYDDTGNLIDRFDWIDTEQYPNLFPFKEYARGYIDRLKREGLAVSTLATHASVANNFVRYIMEVYPFEEITVKTVDEMFEPKNERNMLKYLIEKRGNRDSAISEINRCVNFLVHCELYSTKARKNTPRNRSTVKLQPYRDAMPKEMVAHIVDIIKNRPPQSTTRWDRKKADSSWWKHDVYPVYPMMMLFGYYIPVRGEQVRNLCRDNSFIFNNRGAIETIVINTDKNVNREYLQEIPCVWDDLQEFVPFLKWHKEYYKHLPKVKYHNDDNSPWEDIVPLMITPNVLRPMDRNTHAVYHKKLICKYQIEIIEEAKQRGDDNYQVVAWNKLGKPFFKNTEELDKADSASMEKIGVMYDIHSLRVTGATRYLESGVGLSTVMELTGHKGVTTLMRVYIRLTRDEKVKKLKSAIQEIYFGDKEKLIENSANLIRGELTDAYMAGKKNLETAFEDNALFSLHRKASSATQSLRLEKGTSIALHKHPSSWIGMIHGICPRVQCPEGRENKCSLCPYLITGKLFIEGVVHQTNRAFADFQRESIELHEAKEKGYTSQGYIDRLETKLEELMGWQEILDKISKDISKEDDEENVDPEKQLELMSKKALSVFGTEEIATELAYLKNAYDAKLIGVEQDRYALKVLTIKAMRLAVELADKNQYDLISEDETKSIDMLMQYYTKEVKHKEDAENFVSSIKMIPQIS